MNKILFCIVILLMSPALVSATESVNTILVPTDVEQVPADEGEFVSYVYRLNEVSLKNLFASYVNDSKDIFTDDFIAILPDSSITNKKSDVSIHFNNERQHMEIIDIKNTVPTQAIVTLKLKLNGKSYITTVYLTFDKEWLVSAVHISTQYDEYVIFKIIAFFVIGIILGVGVRGFMPKKDVKRSAKKSSPAKKKKK